MSLKNEIKNATPEFDFTNLNEIWETDVGLPRRIRCGVHNLALTGVLDFSITGTGRQVKFWRANPHADFKSKFL